jgi:hypothetical protein
VESRVPTAAARNEGVTGPFTLPERAWEHDSFQSNYSHTPRMRGQVVKCNVPKRGWINGVGGCPNVGGICIGCTMPGFPDKFMPFMESMPITWRSAPSPFSRFPMAATESETYGSVIRSLRATPLPRSRRSCG